MPNDLIARLRMLAKAQHDDLSIAEEAADEIERLRAEADHWKQVAESHSASIDDHCREIERLRDALTEIADGYDGGEVSSVMLKEIAQSALASGPYNQC